MLPFEFPESNDVLRKPADMTEEECSDLPIARFKYPDGMRGVCSFWKLNKEELEEIQQTGGIYILFVGDTHPPFHPQVENPFK